jgi:hypothetical protein
MRMYRYSSIVRPELAHGYEIRMHKPEDGLVDSGQWTVVRVVTQEQELCGCALYTKDLIYGILTFNVLHKKVLYTKYDEFESGRWINCTHTYCGGSVHLALGAITCAAVMS